MLIACSLIICATENSWEEHFCSTYISVLSADDNEDGDHHICDWHYDGDGDGDYDDNDDDGDDEYDVDDNDDGNDEDDDDSDLKSVKLFTPQHCCEDISRSHDTLTCSSSSSS